MTPIPSTVAPTPQPHIASPSTLRLMPEPLDGVEGGLLATCETLVHSSLHPLCRRRPRLYSHWLNCCLMAATASVECVASGQLRWWRLRLCRFGQREVVSSLSM